jgi:hypothetical protein
MSCKNDLYCMHCLSFTIELLTFVALLFCLMSLMRNGVIGMVQIGFRLFGRGQFVVLMR